MLIRCPALSEVHIADFIGLPYFSGFPSRLKSHLGPSINGLVTDGNTKLCCHGFILVLFQSTTANKIYSEHTRDYKRLLPVCEAEILRVTVKRIEVFSIFMLISDDFRLNMFCGPLLGKG